MISDLDESLKQLLVQKAGLDPASVDVSFDPPTRDWSTPVTKPTVNVYLYDLRENTKLRETYWDEPERSNGRATVSRRPVRVDLLYLVTCWTSAVEDEHRLLWQVLDALFRHSPLPEEVLQGDLRQLTHPVRTEIAQTEGSLGSVPDVWSALDNRLRPSIRLLATLDLDLNEVRSAPLVFARVAKVGQPVQGRDAERREVRIDHLSPGWDTVPTRVGGFVRRPNGAPVPGAFVRLLGLGPEQQPRQIGPTVQTGADGRYVFATVPPGDYILVVEPPGQPPQHAPFTVGVGERSDRLPPLARYVEVAEPT